jgi:hypothetical protein
MRSTPREVVPAWAVALNAKLDVIVANVTRLSLLLGPQDPVDAALLVLIATKVGAGTGFSARELMAHAEYDTVLAAALAEAALANAKQLGWLLRRCDGRVIDGDLTLGRAGQDKDGIIWVFRVSPEKPTPGDTDVCHD